MTSLSWGIRGVIDGRFEHLLALDHALANMTETGVNGALAWPAAPIVWMDYRRQKGGQIVASNAAPAMLYAALANRLKHWKLALWRRPRVALWGI